MQAQQTIETRTVRGWVERFIRNADGTVWILSIERVK